jgi:hypothetical protein
MRETGERAEDDANGAQATISHDELRACRQDEEITDGQSARRRTSKHIQHESSDHAHRARAMMIAGNQPDILEQKDNRTDTDHQSHRELQHRSYPGRHLLHCASFSSLFCP